MHPETEKAIDAIDAAVFSSDTFYDPDARERLRFFIGRWVDELRDLDTLSETENHN